jgi:hypothetical protein
MAGTADTGTSGGVGHVKWIRNRLRKAATADGGVGTPDDEIRAQVSYEIRVVPSSLVGTPAPFYCADMSDGPSTFSTPSGSTVPDKPLTVKCNFNSRRGKLTFQSARNCSYDGLKEKVPITFHPSSPTAC